VTPGGFAHLRGPNRCRIQVEISFSAAGDIVSSMRAYSAGAPVADV